MGIVRVCWEDTCTNTRDIAPCRRCNRGFCPDHMAEYQLCCWCIPVDDNELAKWIIKEEHD